MGPRKSHDSAAKEKPRRNGGITGVRREWNGFPERNGDDAPLQGSGQSAGYQVLEEA